MIGPKARNRVDGKLGRYLRELQRLPQVIEGVGPIILPPCSIRSAPIEAPPSPRRGLNLFGRYGHHGNADLSGVMDDARDQTIISVGVDHLASHAAIDGYLLTCDEFRPIRGEEQNGRSDVAGFADAPGRMLLPVNIAVLHSLSGLRFRPWPCLDPSRQDRIDPDVGTKADRQRMGHGADRALCSGIGFRMWLRLQCAGRCHHDDRALASGTIALASSSIVALLKPVPTLPL